jgi:hypothetical protein
VDQLRGQSIVDSNDIFSGKGEFDSKLDKNHSIIVYNVVSKKSVNQLNGMKLGDQVAQVSYGDSFKVLIQQLVASSARLPRSCVSVDGARMSPSGEDLDIFYTVSDIQHLLDASIIKSPIDKAVSEGIKLGLELGLGL